MGDPLQESQRTQHKASHSHSRAVQVLQSLKYTLNTYDKRDTKKILGLLLSLKS